MNFQQLRIIRETMRRNYNLTEVANALYTSQSGVSKHIKDLEDELGVELFVRRGKRLLGPTQPGEELAEIVERMLHDANNIRQLADQFARRDEGSLAVATTHTQARYVLPRVVAAFREAFPKVHLILHQGSPKEIAAMLASGDADIGVATESLAGVPGLVSFPFYEWHHAVIVPKGHPLAKAGKLTLEQLAKHPLITYHEGYTGRALIDRTFAEAGLAPDIVLSALDSDVIKTYVELGLGVGIIAEMAFVEGREGNLVLRKERALFPANTARIGLRRGHYLRGYGYRFIEQCSSELSEARVRAALAPNGNGEAANDSDDAE
jgi:LysR family cys regulon transcriptional activator